MPGLSQDPDARKRQIEALHRGRQTQARGLLEGLGFGVTEPAKPGRKPGQQPAKPGRVPVHTYPADDEPEPPRAPEPGPTREPTAEPKPQRRGFLAGLLDGAAAD